MTDPRIASLARIVVDYSVGVKPSDKVFMTTTPAATPLVLEIYRLLLQRGATLAPFIDLPGMRPLFFELAGDEQLSEPPPFYREAIETFDVRLAIKSEVNTRELSGIDAARQAARQAALRPITQTFMDRSASGALRWNVCLFPTEAYAQDAEMSLVDFEDFVYAACMADRPDPVAAWRELAGRQQKLIDFLATKHEIHLLGPDTDLRVGINGRGWKNCCGDRNMPDGEVFTGPEETMVDGTVRFSYPAIYQGREVDDVRLRFEAGRVVASSAAKNEQFLTQMLDTDEGARRLGEFAFGSNYRIERFIKDLLFDEKIGGTVHMALGGGYPETGSMNRSAIHWDMICDLRQGGEVRVDGELFARDGKFLMWE
jgi:aminopeptidase